MEQEHWPRVRGTGPLVSRLPMPRASQDNLKFAMPSTTQGIHQDDTPKGSHIPKASKLNASSTRIAAPLGESVNTSIRSRYGWNNQYNRNRSPVRDARQAASSALETTPPSFTADIPVFEAGDENDGERQETKQTAQRRPRPSLSERTVETLTQMSPSPSPTQRQSTVPGREGAMGPPSRPASSMRNSRPNTPSVSTLESTTKRPFRPPGRSSPTKELVTLPAVPSPGSIHTPPRAFVRDHGLKIANPASKRRRSVSSTMQRSVPGSAPAVASKLGRHTMRAKGPYAQISSSTQPPPTLANVFKDPPRTAHSTEHLALSGMQRGFQSLRIQDSDKTSSKPAKTAKRPFPEVVDKTGVLSPKSSAALRETIVAAKAALKAGKLPTSTGSSFLHSSEVDDLRLVENNKGLLRKRIDIAVSTGQLNISAMNLDKIPTEVVSMYDPGGSSIIWSQMVDLVKINAADNKLEELGQDVFPDWSMMEMPENDEKYNIFAGLEAIDLHNNMLQHLPIGFRQLTLLSRLNLNGNRITNQSLDLIWQLPSLKELHLAKNSITGRLSLENVESQQLLILDLHGNQISGFDFPKTKLSSLQKLDLSENQLGQLPWERLASLPLLELNVANNKLTGILLNQVSPGFESLRTFNVSHNALDCLSNQPFKLPTIQTFDVSTNRLASLPDLSKCPTLITLLASNNQLSEFPGGFEMLAALKTADFRQNSLKTLNTGICKMPSLSILNLAGNPLRERRFLSMDTTDVKLHLEKRHAPTEQTATSVSDSIITSEIEQRLDSQYTFKPANGVLDLASQSLATINLASVDLSTGEPVHTLRLSNNDLSALPYDLLSHSSLKHSLKTLNLSHNPLLHPTAYLTDDIFLPSLKFLNVVSTGLTSLDALTTHLKAPALTELNISCHRLTGHVPWIRTYFPSCTTLLATDNWFSSVDVEAVQGLEVLDIRNNEIEILPAKIGLLGNFPSKRSVEEGRLKSFECSGNRFRVPRTAVVEKGTEAVLKDLRRMVPANEVPEEWSEEL